MSLTWRLVKASRSLSPSVWSQLSPSLRSSSSAFASVKFSQQTRFKTSQVDIPRDEPVPGLKFPCIERQEARSLDGGPEPQYDTVVAGFEVFHSPQRFQFHHGGSIPELKVAYETWGELNAARSNAVLIHTGLSASSHAKSHEKNTTPGWWEKFIGPGRSIDTSKFFVICTNVLGGCYGTSGPSTINPETGKQYATTFPILTVTDMINAQALLLDSLGIKKLWASVGSSLGGMQSLALAAHYPDRVGRIVTISAAARSIPYSIAMRYTQRRVLMSDPNWKNGYYYDSVFPHVGMKVDFFILFFFFFSKFSCDSTRDCCCCCSFLVRLPPSAIAAVRSGRRGLGASVPPQGLPHSALTS